MPLSLPTARANRRIYLGLLCVTLSSCGDPITAPLRAAPRADPRWLTGEALSNLDTVSGLFHLSHSWYAVSQSQADSLAVPYVRYIGTAGTFNGYIATLENDRGAPIAFDAIQPCGRTHYVESPFGVLASALPPATRHAFGNQWAVMLCVGDAPELAVSVADDSLAHPVTRGAFDPDTPDGVTAFLPIGIPDRYTSGGPLTAEEAVAFAWRMTGRRIARTPVAYNAYKEFRVGQQASCASWRVIVESPVTLDVAQSDQVIVTDTLFVINAPACFSDSPVLLAALPSQPSTQAIVLPNGDSTVVQVRGPLLFARVSVFP